MNFGVLKDIICELTGYQADSEIIHIEISPKILQMSDLGSTDTVIDFVIVATNYSQSGECIKRWKYHSCDSSKESILELLGEIGEQYREVFGDFDYLVPFPIGIDRFISRGFNQSTVITKKLSKVLQVPVFRGVYRTWSGRHQSTLSKMSRLSRKIQFVHLSSTGINGKNLLIVDDVISTGTSVSNFANYLRSHGAKKIVVFALAWNND